MSFAPNTLYYGDCLDVMREFPDECVDLICLDPPFNSDEDYNLCFKDSGLSINPQIKGFEDMWTWDDAAQKRTQRLKSAIANPASKVISGFESFIPESQMLSYISYMTERLFEMHRILKDTGSIYLHCDPHACHYLRIVMDSLFGEDNFRNEIVWKRNTANNAVTRKYGAIVDYLLFYTKGIKYTWTQQYGERSESAEKEYRFKDESGRIYRTHDLTAPEECLSGTEQSPIGIGHIQEKS